MSRIASRFVVGLCVAIAFASPVNPLKAAEPKVKAEVTPERIYLGESVRYRVTLQDCDHSIEPQLTQFQDFDTRLLGKSTGSQSTTVIVNGQVRSFSQSGPTYEYLLTPKRPGKLVIPAARIEVDGKEYLGPTVALDVAAPSEQDVVILTMAVEPAEVYPLQPYTVKLNVAVKALPSPEGDREPVTVQQNLPQLVMPWADDDNLPSGVKPREPAAEWLRAMLDHGRRPAGFAINNIRTRGGGSRLGGGFPDPNSLLGPGGFADADSLFSLFREESRAAFHPPPQKTTREDLKKHRVGYWEYSFDRTFTSEKLGDVAFGPASLKGMFATRVDTQGNLEGERIYAVSQPVSLRVKDAPLAGRPPDYIGAIGQFEAGAELNPTHVKVGDPMTLNVWLKGSGTLANVSTPRLAENASIAANFKVYEATDQSNNEERRFTFSLRPKQADVREFPAIAMSYFDVAQEKYVTLKTKPIPISIEKADQLASADITLPATNAIDQGPEARVEGVFANITDLSQVRDETVRPRRYMVMLSSMLGAFVLAAVVTSKLRKSKEDIIGQRRRYAVRRARQRLADRTDWSASAISSALRGLVADWLGESEQSLTTVDVHRYLLNLKINADVAERLAHLFEKCDAARYGAQSEPLDRLSDEADGLIDELARELKKSDPL
jgi:hypothetical protein